MDNQRNCIENTICFGGDNANLRKCKDHNDVVTQHHMNGCQILATTPSDREHADYNGEWACKQCLPGYHQISPYNEFCRKMDSEIASFDSQNEQKLKDQLKLCLERKHSRRQIENRHEECFEEGLFGGTDAKDKVTKEDVSSFISAYQQLLAEQDLMMNDKEVSEKTSYTCDVQSPANDTDKSYKFWSGWSLGGGADCMKSQGRCFATDQSIGDSLSNTSDLTYPDDPTIRTRALGLWWDCEESYGSENPPAWCGGRMVLLDIMKLVLNRVTPNPWTEAGFQGREFIGKIGNWLREFTCSWPQGYDNTTRTIRNSKLVSRRTWDDLAGGPNDPKEVFKELLGNSDFDVVTRSCHDDSSPLCTDELFETQYNVEKTAMLN